MGRRRPRGRLERAGRAAAEGGPAAAVAARRGAPLRGPSAPAPRTAGPCRPLPRRAPGRGPAGAAGAAPLGPLRSGRCALRRPFPLLGAPRAPRCALLAAGWSARRRGRPARRSGSRSLPCSLARSVPRWLRSPPPPPAARPLRAPPPQPSPPLPAAGPCAAAPRPPGIPSPLCPGLPFLPEEDNLLPQRPYKPSPQPPGLN